MSRKRRIFDLELPEEATEAENFPSGKAATSEAKSPRPPRRGPMASAVQENAEALRTRAAQEAAIRAENDALAEELVRLKKLGLVVDLIPIDAVDTTKLVRDRAQTNDVDLTELKASIRDLGLSNPIRVQAMGHGRFELVQGLRRLAAYRELLAETKDSKFALIPAGLIPDGECLESLYRRMVDENLVRKDISFAEMAQLARSYAADPGTDCHDADKAVAILFQSAGYQKRSYIRAFVVLLDRLSDYLKFAPEIPRNLGLAPRQRIEEAPSALEGIKRELQEWENHSASDELEVLRRWASAAEDYEIFPTGKTLVPVSSARTRRAKTTFQIARAEGTAKCTAANGRLEIRLPLDFSTVGRRRLEAAVVSLLDSFS